MGFLGKRWRALAGMAFPHLAHGRLDGRLCQDPSAVSCSSFCGTHRSRSISNTKRHNRFRKMSPSAMSEPVIAGRRCPTTRRKCRCPSCLPLGLERQPPGSLLVLASRATSLGGVTVIAIARCCSTRRISCEASVDTKSAICPKGITVTAPSYSRTATRIELYGERVRGAGLRVGRRGEGWQVYAPAEEPKIRGHGPDGRPLPCPAPSGELRPRGHVLVPTRPWIG